MWWFQIPIIFFSLAAPGGWICATCSLPDMRRTDRVCRRWGTIHFNQTKAAVLLGHIYAWYIFTLQFRLLISNIQPWNRDAPKHSPAWILRRFAGGFCHQSDHRTIVLVMGFACHKKTAISKQRDRIYDYICQTIILEIESHNLRNTKVKFCVCIPQNLDWPNLFSSWEAPTTHSHLNFCSSVVWQLNQRRRHCFTQRCKSVDNWRVFTDGPLTMLM